MLLFSKNLVDFLALSIVLLPLPNRMESLISIDECEIIIQRVTKEKSTDIENYAIKKIGDEYPGFLGEYFELTVNYKDVSSLII